ncbi:hypothetical protein L4G92_07875 [Neisseria sp. ZJ106]|uniref:Uncharacterized protein n=1 Tax=Neisseria lisongii TaxID=2912188 RepID=A0ABY7RJS6_9NEIS|nr:hypothetical protein [Neisseria lisongii]MCF7521961.1 hypothetical protein [Neisseria lisongii]WCL71335.1 hypothetical protein PJU73_08365 [Neisseria lisongii]WCL72329.1 hypothetical protein PJU73_04315 [Neisseria lisongii]
MVITVFNIIYILLIGLHHFGMLYLVTPFRIFLDILFLLLNVVYFLHKRIVKKRNQPKDGLFTETIPPNKPLSPNSEAKKFMADLNKLREQKGEPIKMRK